MSKPKTISIVIKMVVIKPEKTSPYILKNNVVIKESPKERHVGAIGVNSDPKKAHI